MHTDTPDLALFVRTLADEKGLTNLDPEVRAQVEQDLLDRVENRLNAAIIAHMPPAKLGEFEAVIDAGDDAAIQAFTEEAIPGLAEVLAQELLNLRETYING